MYTDQFTINQEYQDILDDIGLVDIGLTLENGKIDNNISSIISISDVEDLDNLENDPKDNSKLMNILVENPLPSQSNTSVWTYCRG